MRTSDRSQAGPGPADDRLTRRALLQNGTAAGIGLGLSGSFPGVRAQALAAALPPSGTAEARADGIIQIFLGGGLSHLDSFDPKPEAPVEVRGELKPVATKISGEQFSELLRRTAGVADRLTVIRSMTHTEADHSRGTHNMLTGYRPSPAIAYPSIGAVVAHELGVRNDLPPYVAVAGGVGEFMGTGYLSAAHAPFLIGGDPARSDFRVRDLAAPSGVDAERQKRRRDFLHDLDGRFPEVGAADVVDANDAFYRQAYALIESPEARAAFDLRAEKDAVVERYGRTRLGMQLLLSRRLIEGGVRHVTVSTGGFDHHSQIYRALPPLLRTVDRAFAALIADLDARGLLDRTLVVLTSEFGRTPRINPDSGRDHWPRVFSTVVAGGGMKRGYVHGRSNASGAEPESDPVSPADLAATLFTQLGIDPTHKLLAPGGRPIDIVRGGRVLREVLA